MIKDRYDLCIVGGGPAGMTLAAFAADMGLSCVVIDARASSHSEFRGESIAPDAVWILRNLGIINAISDTEVLEVAGLRLRDAGKQVLSINFDEFGYPEARPLEIPQQLLLAKLEASAIKSADCTIYRNMRVVELLRSEDGRIEGVSASHQDGSKEKFYAHLIVGADGRYSTVRKLAGIAFQELPLERDFLWFKMLYPTIWASDQLLYRVSLKGSQQAVAIPTVPNLIRVGINIPKGSLKSLRSGNISALHDVVDNLIPELSLGLREEITSWSDTRVLDIFTTYVKVWHQPGIVLIGDAAHTLSPILGQGISHAICDAALLALLISENTQPADLAKMQQILSNFQKIRENSIEKARSLQLRQETLFRAKGVFSCLGRRLLYRGMNVSDMAKKKVWGDLYYAEQREGLIKESIMSNYLPATNKPPSYIKE